SCSGSCSGSVFSGSCSGSCSGSVFSGSCSGSVFSGVISVSGLVFSGVSCSEVVGGEVWDSEELIFLFVLICSRMSSMAFSNCGSLF
ncbi:MAG TPA: hypothetical protein PKM32_04300, partial [Planctomycetota bacterium]|nr:hypothetical protein [Planctomycetota bacterium]